MSGADSFYDTLAEYLSIRLGQASLSPAETVILVLTLAAALLCALHLWRIGRQEDRRDRLAALRGVGSTLNRACPMRSICSSSALRRG